MGTANTVNEDIQSLPWPYGPSQWLMVCYDGERFAIEKQMYQSFLIPEIMAKHSFCIWAYFFYTEPKVPESYARYQSRQKCLVVDKLSKRGYFTTFHHKMSFILCLKTALSPFKWAIINA